MKILKIVFALVLVCTTLLIGLFLLESKQIQNSKVLPSTILKPAEIVKSSPVVITPKPTIKSKAGVWECNRSKTCLEISSCSEAQYQLNECGCYQRDADDDGVACDSECQ